MDATHIPELVSKTGYPVLFQMYEAIPGVRQMIADVRPVDASTMYGTKGTTIIGGSDLEKRLDGEGVARDRMETGYTWQIQVNNYGKELFLPNRLIEASSSTEVGNIISEWAATVGQNAAYQKEKFVANQLQLGTIAAGDEIFDGSFPGNVDANPTKIYDGQPLFSASHPIIVGSSTYANYGVSRTLTSANLTAAKIEMSQTSAVDDRGNRIMNMPRYLIVPPSMEATAKVLLESDLLPGGSNNDVNIHRGTLELIVNPFISDAASSAAWWLKSMNVPCLRFYDDGVPKLKTYADDERDGTVVQMLSYWGGGAVDWRGLQANNKAAS